MACPVPILLLAFNRPENTKLVLEQIRRVKPVRLYLHCDGPRLHVDSDAEKVIAVRQLINDFKIDEHIEVNTLFRTENFGLRKGVYHALNWFFELEEYGIVLEDDCVPDLSFFQFCSELLLRYKDVEQIMHIAGSNLSEVQCRNLQTSYVFSRFSFVWGWASWRRAWRCMDVNLESLDEFERNGGMNRYLPNRLAREYMFHKFVQTRSGKNNSWAYAWFYSILKQGGYCIVPKVNLIQNTGVGQGDATHTKKRNKKAELRAGALAFPLVHPERVEVHDNLERTFFYSTQKSFWRLKIWALLHALGLR